MEFDVTDKIVKDKESFIRAANFVFIIIIAAFFIGCIVFISAGVMLSQMVFILFGLAFLLADIVVFVCWRIAKRKGFKSTYKHFRLEGDEAKYFLFGKKVAPCCNIKMDKIVENEPEKEGLFKIGKDEQQLTAYGESYNVTIKYKCPKCSRIYSISELVKKDK